jgi:hypothetical protein
MLNKPRSSGRGAFRDEKAAAEFLTQLGIPTSIRTLQARRARAEAPAYHKVGGRRRSRVYYAEQDLIAFVESGRVEPASAQG